MLHEHKHTFDTPHGVNVTTNAKHTIPLKEYAKIPELGLRKMSPAELVELKAKIDEFVAN